jgi:hypothetical protein
MTELLAVGGSFVVSYQRQSVPNCLTARRNIGYGLAEIWLCDTAILAQRRTSLSPQTRVNQLKDISVLA